MRAASLRQAGTKLELHLAEGRLGAPERADGGGRGGENGSGIGAVSAQNRFQGTDLVETPLNAEAG